MSMVVNPFTFSPQFVSDPANSNRHFISMPSVSESQSPWVTWFLVSSPSWSSYSLQLIHRRPRQRNYFTTHSFLESAPRPLNCFPILGDFLKRLISEDVKTASLLFLNVYGTKRETAMKMLLSLVYAEARDGENVLGRLVQAICESDQNSEADVMDFLSTYCQRACVLWVACYFFFILDWFFFSGIDFKPWGFGHKRINNHLCPLTRTTAAFSGCSIHHHDLLLHSKVQTDYMPFVTK